MRRKHRLSIKRYIWWIFNMYSTRERRKNYLPLPNGVFNDFGLATAAADAANCDSTDLSSFTAAATSLLFAIIIFFNRLDDDDEDVVIVAVDAVDADTTEAATVDTVAAVAAATADADELFRNTKIDWDLSSRLRVCNRIGPSAEPFLWIRCCTIIDPSGSCELFLTVADCSTIVPWCGWWCWWWPSPALMAAGWRKIVPPPPPPSVECLAFLKRECCKRIGLSSSFRRLNNSWLFCSTIWPFSLREPRTRMMLPWWCCGGAINWWWCDWADTNCSCCGTDVEDDDVWDDAVAAAAAVKVVTVDCCCFGCWFDWLMGIILSRELRGAGGRSG